MSVSRLSESPGRRSERDVSRHVTGMTLTSKTPGAGTETNAADGEESEPAGTAAEMSSPAESDQTEGSGPVFAEQPTEQQAASAGTQVQEVPVGAEPAARRSFVPVLVLLLFLLLLIIVCVILLLFHQRKERERRRRRQAARRRKQRERELQRRYEEEAEEQGEDYDEEE